jgi:MoaA/NifB/PqqE/SkfB family radical SAM enzyme
MSSEPSGLHLFCRRTGLNVLCDEIRVPPTLWASAPQQISVALTNACDLACSYCYAPKNRAELDIATLVIWLHELDANGCLAVGFGGGEPVLHRHFVELCQHVAKETALAVTFTTHAQRVDEALADRIRGNVHFVRVSMDGVGATYEMLRV